MSIVTPKRVFLFVLAVLFVVSSAEAANPSPRSYARMTFDQQEGVGVLFGGRGPFDGATQVAHGSDETWLWTGSRWVQRFPLNRPSPRSVHSMVYDSTRGRVVLFGGRQEPGTPETYATYLNDTWFWKNDEWTRIETPDAPSPRHYAGMAYDPERDRIVLFGGNVATADGKNVEAVFDTWEFDGSNWVRSTASQPSVAKPVLGWDAARKQIIMLAVSNSDLSRLMYRYVPAQMSWVQITPETLPTCVNEGWLFFNERSQKLALLGGVCSTGTPTLDEVFEWDGTNWTKAAIGEIARSAGQAIAFDSVRNLLVVYGGNSVFSTEPRSATYTLKDGAWRFAYANVRPEARSLASFQGDPLNGTVWLYGGIDQTNSIYTGDFWGYRSGQWFQVNAEGGPGAACASPLSAYDSDRSRLVVACAGSVVHEWDGSEWKSFSSLNRVPDQRRFGALVYDRNLKKIVMFGGYGANYRDDTWLWDGAQWTEVKGKKPPHRALMSMWYDPLQQKTILYSGLGRPSINSKVVRYSDMWSFNGTDWTKMDVSTTPGERFGAQIAIHPVSGKLLLFGGLRSEMINEKTLRQFFDDETWEWNGTTSQWTKLGPSRSPAARENGMLSWDPLNNQMVLFGGYNAGFFFSDVWTWDGQTWSPVIDTGLLRRRAAR
jgi:hypothetical protein